MVLYKEKPSKDSFILIGKRDLNARPHVPNVALYQTEFSKRLTIRWAFYLGAEDGLNPRPHHGKVMFYHWTTSA